MSAVTLGGELRTESGDGGLVDGWVDGLVDSLVGGAGGVVSLALMEAVVARFCAGFDPGLLTASEASAVVPRLSVVERQITAARGSTARRVDGSSVWKHRGFRSSAEWMAATTGDAVSASAGLLAAARQLESLPATAEAFAAGAVSLQAAREIAGAVAVDPTAEAGLLAVAAKGDHRQLVDSAARVRQAARSAEDETARHARLRARRFARTRTDADGLVVLHAGFAPKDWAPFAARLQRATDAEFARARREGRRDSPDAYAADALLAMLATTTHPPAPTADDPPPTVPAVPVKAEVLVLVDAISLQRGYARGGERCEIVGVGPVSVEWVRELLPEAIVHALVHDGVDITTYAPIRKPRAGRVGSSEKRVAPGR